MFKERIKELRKGRNLSQEDMANSLKIAKSTYIKYEKGTQSPQLEIIEKIAVLYGLDASQIIGESTPTLNNQLISKLNLINQLEDDEKRSLIMVIEGIVFRHQNYKLKKEFSTEN